MADPFRVRPLHHFLGPCPRVCTVATIGPSLQDDESVEKSWRQSKTYEISGVKETILYLISVAFGPVKKDNPSRKIGMISSSTLVNMV